VPPHEGLHVASGEIVDISTPTPMPTRTGSLILPPPIGFDVVGVVDLTCSSDDNWVLSACTAPPWSDSSNAG